MAEVHANSLAARPVFVFAMKEEMGLNHESQPTGCVQGLCDEEEHSMASVRAAGQGPAPHRLWILPDTVGGNGRPETRGGRVGALEHGQIRNFEKPVAVSAGTAWTGAGPEWRQEDQRGGY